jgi:hypothetical protein
MTPPNRLPGGQIDRSKTLTFHFDGKPFKGHPGDTLASALLANGVRLMGRSFKYHRPRGPLTAGSEEPNALVELRAGAWQEPNTRATTVELYDGLWAKSQNRLGSLQFDLLSINDRLSNFLTAGFYYKTFMWPAAFWEKLYEPIIRHAAGLGALSGQADPDVYDKGFLHCDLLVIGAGPSGLMAALTAGRAGRDVILADEDFRMGGRLNSETHALGDQPGADWAAEAVAELASLPKVRLMPRTTVIGAFDHGIYGAVERISDHLFRPDPGKPRQVLWRIYAGKTILCAGATEQRPPGHPDGLRDPHLCEPLCGYACAAGHALHQQRRRPPHGTRPASERHPHLRRRRRAPRCAPQPGFRSAARRAGHRHEGPPRPHLRRGAAGRWQYAHHRVQCAGALGRLEPECAPDLPPARTARLERQPCSLRARRGAAARPLRRGCCKR